MFEKFFLFEGEDKIIIQLDTAEIEQYGINRPNKKSETYTEDLRELVIKLIHKWLDNEYIEDLIYAISIEELEAWILTLYEQKDSSKPTTPKKKLKAILAKKNISVEENHRNYLKISKDFSRPKKLDKALQYNESLDLFCKELKQL